MVSESHKKQSVIFNLNIAMQNNEAAKHDPVYEDKLEHIQSEWKGIVHYLTFESKALMTSFESYGTKNKILTVN